MLKMFHKIIFFLQISCILRTMPYPSNYNIEEKRNLAAFQNTTNLTFLIYTLHLGWAGEEGGEFSN